MDAVTYDISGITYLPEGMKDFCELAASPEDEEITEHNTQRKQAVFDANLVFQILAESQAGTKSLIKPLYANGITSPALMLRMSTMLKLSAVTCCPRSILLPPPSTGKP